MTTPAALNPEVLAEVLAELKDATADLEFAIARIAASKDFGPGTIADKRLAAAAQARNDAADKCEEVARTLRSLARNA